MLFVAGEILAQDNFSNHTNVAIEKVIRDYPRQFVNIRGALLASENDHADYVSNIQIPGSISCVVSWRQLHSREAISWKAELYSTGSFNEAARRYRDLYQQIRNSIVKMDGTKPFILSGQLEPPAENKKIHSTVFSMIPSLQNVQDLKVALLLVRHGTAWKISVVIHDMPSGGDMVSFFNVD